MRRPDDAELAALGRLRASADWARVRDWLAASLAEQDRANRRTAGEGVYRGQGYAQALEDILHTADNALESLRQR